MDCEVKDVDDVVLIIAEKLLMNFFKKPLWYKDQLHIDIHNFRTFRNFMNVFRRYSNIDSPLLSQALLMADCIRGYSSYTYDIVANIFRNDSHILLKYIIDLGYGSSITNSMQLINIWINCAKCLYETKSTRESLIIYLRSEYSSAFRNVEFNKIDKNNYIQMCHFVVKKHIIDPDKMLSMMVSNLVDLQIIESFIVRYKADYCIPVIGYAMCNYYRELVHLYMRYFDHCAVFADFVSRCGDHIFIAELFEKYNIASKMTKKFNYKNIYQIKIAMYLIMQGVCDYNENEFWQHYSDFEADYDALRPHLRFLYDNSTCSVCLSVNLLGICDSQLCNVSKKILVDLQMYPQKLCSSCISMQKIE
jgi:hypothetical protein